MKSRPTVFLSGVSHEFGSFRDAIENEIEMKGCFAENQPGFPPDYHTVEEMLTRKIGDSDLVIHLVGFRFGAEPNQRPAGVPRRSYTQMELDIARRLDKPVYVFLSKSPEVRQPPRAEEQPEDAEASQIQLAHRAAVTTTNSLYYFFADTAQLCKLVAEIPIVAAAGFRTDVSRIDRYAPDRLIGRDSEITILGDAWARVRRAETPRANIITFVALGGEGKTSLVANWTASLAAASWPGCDAAFAWSFYSQGTRDQSAASADLFLAEALTFFGEPTMARSARTAQEKGKRLAELIGERRALLVLDGLEPLQYPPTSPLAGQLKDPGLSALLKGLAARNAGLCLVTTRYSVTDLKNYRQTTAPEIRLLRLSPEAGVALLRSLGVHGSQADCERLVADVKGHALTLNLLGKYLADAHGGDIRRRDRISLDAADDEEQGGHAFRVLDAYVTWFEQDGDKGRRAIAVLRLLGLFDRPASADCLAALKRAPVIVGVTEALVGMSEEQWNLTLARLEAASLLTVNRDAARTLLSLDAHPLLREYFARQLRTRNPEADRAAHRRLFEYLCVTTKDKEEPSLDDLQPLFQAVLHGCRAGLHQAACDDVLYARIRRGNQFYSIAKLGAFGAEIGAIACFFERLWTDVSPTLTIRTQGWLVNEAAYDLRALGRLAEALEPRRAGLRMRVEEEAWDSAAISAINLSELEMALGLVEVAVQDADQAVRYAERSALMYKRMASYVALAGTLHQNGRWGEAAALFRKAEALQAEREPHHPLLSGLQACRYCDLLLARPERAAWRPCYPHPDRDDLLRVCHDIEQRGRTIFEWRVPSPSLLTIPLDHLSLGHATLIAGLLGGNRDDEKAREHLVAAVDGFRRAGHQDYIPRGLLDRAWFFGVEAGSFQQRGDLTRSAECQRLAQADLDEAWEIAEFGPMPLFQADILLYRARLFHDVVPYPWPGGARDDLAAVRRLIEKCAYWRRKEELEDAEADARNWRT
jgi:hypothetical protein